MTARVNSIFSCPLWNHTRYFQILKIENYYDTTQETKYKNRYYVLVS